MSVQIKKFRTVVNKHIKFNKMNPPEKLNVVSSDTGSYAYLSECVADNNPANFQGLKETLEGEFILPGENTYTIDYNSALIAFSDRYTIPSTLYAYYWGGGSVIWAEDVTDLQEACNTIHSNALYKDGSVALEGDLNLNGHQLRNVTTINSINLGTHKHLGQEIDGTTQLTEDSISDLSMSKITGLQTALDSKQNKLPTYQSGKFLTNNGSALSWGLPYTRNIGEIIQSILPLNDTKLHLLDGDTLSGVGTYNELYNYLLNNSTVTQYVSGVGIIGSLQNLNHVLSGFSASSYAQIPLTFGSVNQEDWEIQIKFKYKAPASSGASHYQDLISSELSTAASRIYFFTQGTSTYMQFRISITFTNSNGTQETLERTLSMSQLVNDNDYWLRYGYENSEFYVKISEDGINFTSALTGVNQLRNITFPIYEKSFLNLGIHTGVSSLSPWLGSIDLNECYIDSNGVRLWQGGITYNKPESDFIVDEGIWKSVYAKYNSCGNFILDTFNQTVRLPYIRGIIQGTVNTSRVGLITPAGLPNITGSIEKVLSYTTSSAPSTSGALRMNYSAARSVDSGGYNTSSSKMSLNASRSNTIYGNSDTVQPQTVRVLNYMVVSK